MKRPTSKRAAPKHPTPKRPAHWLGKSIFVVYLLAIIWTSLAHGVEDKFQAPSLSPSPARQFTSHPHGQSKVRAYVEGEAKTKGVDPQIAEWIVKHESSHNPRAIGDGGESRGLWQINKDWHPEVSDACAYNVTCSTDWSLNRIRGGHVDEWSTWKYCKERFANCPFDSRPQSRPGTYGTTAEPHSAMHWTR